MTIAWLRGRWPIVAVLFGGLALALALFVVGCSMLAHGGGTSGDTSQVALAKLTWCDQPSIQFQDNSTANQTTLTDWAQVKDQLNFTPYLPATLPKGACLALAGGAIHDAIFGGRMSITYVLPDGSPLSFSEAPKRGGLGGSLQCQASTPTRTATAAATATSTATTTPSGAGQATTTPTATTTICIGSVANTTVTIASRQSESDVRAQFDALKPNVDWVPGGTLATPAASPSASTTTTTTATATK